MKNSNEIDIYKVSTPMDLVKQSIGKEVYVKCKYDRELKGKLHVRNNFFLIKIITIGI